MKREQVWQRVSESLRDGFGRLLDVRDVRRVRRVAGDAWMVTVVLGAQTGDLHVADLTVDDTGTISPTLGPDHVVEAVKRADRASRMPAKPPDELADFGGFGPNSDEEPGLGMVSEIEEPVDVRVATAIGRGDPASLREARELLPRLLTDHDHRGRTLLTIAAVELSLGEPMLARGYLEASAREFADRFDLDSLEKAATLALEIVGREAFAGSPVHTLLEQSRQRLKPFHSIFDARSFAGLPMALRDKLEPHMTLTHARPSGGARERGRAVTSDLRGEERARRRMARKTGGRLVARAVLLPGMAARRIERARRPLVE